MPKTSTVVATAVADFLRHLRERNASPHTIKAYTGDLANFAAYAGSRGWKQIDHIAIRGFLSQLYEKGLSKTSVARSLAAVRSLYRWLATEGVVDQNPAKLVATPKLPKKLPRVPTIEEMNSVLDGQMPETAAFPAARPPDAGVALWMRHPQFRTDGHQLRRHPAERRSHSDPGEGEEGALRSIRRFSESRARRVSSCRARQLSRKQERIRRHC